MKKQIGLTLAALMTVSMLAACQPGATPGVGETPDVTTPANPDAETDTGADVSPSLSEESAELKESLAAVHDDEDSFADADALASEDPAFSTKQLRSRLEAGVDLTARVDAPRLREGAETLRKKARDRQRIRNLRNKLFKMAAAAELRAAVMASGAVTVDADGMVTIDTAKLKAFTKEQLAERKAMIKAKIETLKPKLQAKAEVAKDKLQNLRRKNVVVRTSEVVNTENEDGSVTKTVEIEFSNERTGVTRNVVVSNTFDAEGNLTHKDYQLTASTKAYERTVVRTVDITAEGRTIKHEGTTTWKNGRMREVSYERFVDAEGNSSGVGTITITKADGTSTVHEMTISSMASGELETAASSDDGEADVVISESAEGDATVTEGSGEEEAVQSDVDLAAVVEAEAEATEAEATEGESTEGESAEGESAEGEATEGEATAV